MNLETEKFLAVDWGRIIVGRGGVVGSAKTMLLEQRQLESFPEVLSQLEKYAAREKG